MLWDGVTPPKFLTDVEALELIYGPEPEILDVEDFRPYQIWMANKAVELPRLLLGAEMGLGKTGSTLYATTRLLDAGEVRRVLIVAPLKVAEETWPAEIAKWRFARHLSYCVVTGTEQERLAALAQDRTVQITIINRENIKWLRKALPGRRWDFDMIIYDEASRLKSGRKKTQPTVRKDGTVGTPALTELGVFQQVRFKTKRVIELSGTPSPNGIIDLWGPMYLLDEGKRLGSSITAYRQRWFTENTRSKKFEPHEHSEKEVMDRIADVFFSLREEDYLKLPPLVPVDHYVTLPPKVMARYKSLEKEMALDVVNRAGEREVIEAVNNGVLAGKLLQFANGSLYLGDKYDEETDQMLPKESVKVHELKLEKLDSIVEEAMGKPMLVAYSFKFDKEAIRNRYPFCRVYGESQHDMRDWNAGKIRMLLTHPLSAGHGLNFQRGSNIQVWYGLTHSLELYRQFIKRLHRSGQKAERVFLHRIMTKGTLDEELLPLLVQRGMTQDRISDRVRVRLERLAA